MTDVSSLEMLKLSLVECCLLGVSRGKYGKCDSTQSGSSQRVLRSKGYIPVTLKPETMLACVIELVQASLKRGEIEYRVTTFPGLFAKLASKQFFKGQNSSYLRAVTSAWCWEEE